MRKFLLIVAALGVANGAHAADLPDFGALRGAVVDGVPVRAVNWQGYYIGGQASYGSTVSKIPSTINSDLHPVYSAATGAYSWPGLATPHANNTGFGGFAGYNSQWDDVVIGIEANYIHGKYNSISSSAGYSSDVNGQLLTTNSSASVKIDDFGSLRARAGYAINCFLPYLFVGGGVGNMVVERSTTVTPGPSLAAPAPLTMTAAKSNLVYGYSAGAGVDIMLMAGLFLRAEYEYQRIASKDIDSNVNSARVGVGYKF
ncbi:outer membrane beta-barrel protein [soil metagenome]